MELARHSNPGQEPPGESYVMPSVWGKLGKWSLRRTEQTRHQKLSASKDFAAVDFSTSTAAAFNQGMQLTLRFAPG